MPDRLGEPLGVVERRRAPGEVAQQRAQLLEEARVLAGGDPGGLQLGQRRHQRLGHVLAPVGAEAVLDGRRAHDTAARGRRGDGHERLHLGRVLDARRGLGAGRDVDGVGLHGGDPLGDVLGGQPAGQDRGDLRAPLGGEAPVPRLPGAAVHPGSGGVEQVVVDPEALQGLQVGAGGDARRLDDLGAGPPRDLGGEGRSLVAVQLHVGEADRVGRVGDLVQRRVHEHPDQLDAAPHGARDPGCHAGLDGALGPRPQDEADRPGAQRGRLLGVLEARDAADLDPGHGSHPRS